MTFNNPIKYAKQKELFIAPEGMYTGQVQAVSATTIVLHCRALTDSYADPCTCCSSCMLARGRI